jgi:hypothetical protein
MFLSSFVSIVPFVVKNLPRSQQQKFTTKDTKFTKAAQKQTYLDCPHAEALCGLANINTFFLRALRALRGENCRAGVLPSAAAATAWPNRFFLLFLRQASDCYHT